MIKVGKDTKRKIQRLFSKKQWNLVEKMIVDECSENIISYSNGELERVRQGILKISNGDIKRLKDSIEWAKIDWRDILLTAGFAENPEAHKNWEP
jgi:hypothetical protein